MENNFYNQNRSYQEPYPQNKTIDVLPKEMQSAQARYMAKVYAWMAGALALTGLISYFVASTPALIQAIVANRILFFVLLFAELGLVIWLSARIHKMSYTTAIGGFIAYAVLNGLTLSFIFLVYTMSSIASTFFITAGTFAVMSFYGYVTKTDLTKVGKIFMMLLVGLIIASVVNMFMKSPTLYWIITYVGVAIFVGLIAYDTQKIKNFYAQAAGQPNMLRKIAILGALNLYLDFINLFLFLLRLFGGSRD